MSTTEPSPTTGLTDADFKTYLEDPRFHRTFHLPVDPSRGRTQPYHVKYADYGFKSGGGGGGVDDAPLDSARDEHGREESNGEQEGMEGEAAQEKVVLFFGPLLATRMLHVAKDALAKRERVRIIDVDRPGIGGTDAVPSDQLLDTWREVIPALLTHLNIPHVSIACQSGGFIYALDTILHNPHILHPTHPYLAVGGPWVHPSHSGVTTMALAASLPAGLLGQVDKLTTFIHDNIDPLAGISLSVWDAVKKAVVGPTPPKRRTGSSEADARFEAGLFASMVDGATVEGVVGLSNETKLLLQRVDGVEGFAADWRDVDDLVPRLPGALKSAGVGGTLRVDVFLAEKDGMVGDPGTKGPKWLEEELRRDEAGLDVRVEVVEGTEHETVWMMRWDAAEKMLRRVSEMGSEGGR